MDQDRMGGAVKSAAGKVEGAAGDLAGDDKLKASGLIDDAIGQVQNGMGRAKDNLRGTINTLSEQARSAASGVQEQMGNAGETFGTMVQENPVAALLTAAGVGYLLAFLIHRR